MFEVPTVLVLGAGASWHYNYPLGTELVDEIITKTPKDRTESNKLAKALRFYDPLSIDSFLNYFRHDPKLVSAGKLEIAKVILKAENKECFERNQNPVENRGNWYKYIANAITSSLKNPIELLENPLNLTIITFNYDLSLEYYLYSRFNNIPTFDDEQNAKFLTRLNESIIHVYGQVGKFKWQGGKRDNEEYGFCQKMAEKRRRRNDYDMEYLEEDIEYEAYNYAQSFSEQIQLINEREDDKSDIHKKLQEAKKVYFLGFGFDKANCKLLDIAESCKHMEEIYFTNFQESQLIKNYTKNNLFSLYETKNMSGSRYALDKAFYSSKTVYDALTYDFSLT